MIKCEFENGNKALLRHVVVDVLILKGDKVLLTKRNERLVEGGKWSLVGGYVERDEVLKEAVERETMEESGYKVKNIELLTVVDNPNRPGEDRQNIAFVFVVKAVKKIGKSDWEVDDQKWFKLNNLPPKKEIAFDHYESIQFYLNKIEKH